MVLESDEQWLALADAFGAAAFDGDGWIPALRDLARATGSSHGQLIGVDGQARLSFNLVNDVPDARMAEFAAIDGGGAAVNPRIAAGLKAPVLAIVSEADYEALSPPPKTNPYADWAERTEAPYGCQTNLIKTEDGFVSLAVLRSRPEGPTSTEDRSLFASLAPHVRSAVKMQMRLEGQAAGLIAGTLESLALAAFVLDGDGLVQAVTSPAETLLRDAPQLQLRRGRLMSRGCAAAALETAISRAVHDPTRPAGPASSTVVLAPQTPDAPPVVLDVLRLPRRPWSFDFDPRALIVARGSSGRDDGAGVLQAAYDLTAAEAAVALWLARGRSREAIAAARGASIETVRTQIRSIFHKIGVSRELELAARLAPLI